MADVLVNGRRRILNKSVKTFLCSEFISKYKELLANKKVKGVEHLENNFSKSILDIK